jgi:phenylacetate-CoA ligase
MMIIRGVNVFPTQIEELILKQPELAPHYICEITRPLHLDELTVRVEVDPAHAALGAEIRNHAATTLAHRMKELIGVTANIELVAPGGIERSLGKAKRVVDKRAK